MPRTPLTRFDWTKPEGDEEQRILPINSTRAGVIRGVLSVPTVADMAAETAAREAADADLQEQIDQGGGGGGVTPEELAAEVAARISGDTGLQDQINSIEAVSSEDLAAEATARAAADTTLTTNLATEVTNRTNAVSAEATTRGNADTTLQGNINAEATTRGNADTTLTNNLAAEVTNRTNADTALGTLISTEVTDRQAAITAEASARSGADTTLQGNINSEASTRGAADSALTSAINAVASDLVTEASTRAGADSTLQGNINAEATTRGNADTTLTTNLAAEVTNRQNADTTLQGNITSEAADRAAADTALQEQIDDFEGVDQAALDAETAARIAANQSGVHPRLDATADANGAVLDRIDGKTPSATTLDIYTSDAESGATPYVRNPDCWLADVDMTCISPWSSTHNNTIGATAITRWHVIGANHSFTDVGGTLRFIEPDGTVITRTVAAKQQAPGQDIEILLLNSALPDTIVPAKFLPTNYADFLTDYLTAGVYPNQDQEMHACAIRGPASSIVISPGSPISAWYETLESGDSGNAGFFVLGGQLVIAAVITGVAEGIWLTDVISEIESAITATGNDQPLTYFQMRHSVDWRAVRNPPDFGTAAFLDVGILEGQIPQLEAGGTLPASTIPAAEDPGITVIQVGSGALVGRVIRADPDTGEDNAWACFQPVGDDGFFTLTPYESGVMDLCGPKALDLQMQRALQTQAATGAASAILGGRNNTAAPELSIAMGDGATPVNTGSIAWSPGPIANPGDVQTSSVSLYVRTTDDTGTYLAKLGVASIKNSTNRAYRFKGHLVAHSSTKMKHWDVDVAMHTQASSGSTVFLGGITEVAALSSAGTDGWDAFVDKDGYKFAAFVIGEDGVTITWHLHLDATEAGSASPFAP